MKKIQERKRKEVEELKKFLNQDTCIGIVDLTNLPSAQFQKIRNKLKDNLYIRTSKKSLIKIAIHDIKGSKKNIEKLESHLDKSIPALLFTKEDPFQIAKLISKNKSKLPAKQGQISPKDIVIPAGPTNFSPGPIIGELGAAGIKAAIEAGKVVIKQDVHLIKKGDKITQKQSDLLAKFNIQPMEISLNLLAIYQNGNIFYKEDLFIDEAEYTERIKTLVREALNLAVYIVYPAKETINILLQKAERENLCIESKVDFEKVAEEKKEEQAIKEENPEPKKETEQVKEEIKQINQLKNPVEYTDEGSQKAQEIINKMKDKVNGG